MNNAAPSGRDGLALAEAIANAFRRDDWKAIERLFHPDAVLATVATGRAPMPARDALPLIREKTRHRIWHAVWRDPYPLDAHAAVLRASLRQPYDDGAGWSLSHVAWLITARDGLIYRTQAFGHAQDAERAYREHGVSLGFELPGAVGERGVVPVDDRGGQPELPNP